MQKASVVRVTATGEIEDAEASWHEREQGIDQEGPSSVLAPCTGR